MLELTARSIAEVLERVAQVRSDWGTNIATSEEIWFRGSDARSWPLLPGLYRPSVGAYDYDELTLFERFKALAAHFVVRRPELDWEWYCVAQHYGLPTRLLDWTENLFAALYFAIEPHTRGWDRPAFEAALQTSKEEPIFGPEAPTLWILEAGTLNQHSLGEDCIAVPGGPKLEHYLPAQLNPGSDSNEFPVGFLPMRTSDRIVVQQGMFTVHGYSRLSIDTLAEDSSTKVRLAAITLDRNNIAKMWETLQLAGINRLSLFPEMASVAPHVCWLHQGAQGDGIATKKKD